MRMPSSSSVILTLASSASLGALVNAAPTPDGTESAVAPAPGSDAAPGGDAIAGILNSFGAPDVPMERRQLGGVVDTVANMVPLVDAILGIVGLQRKDAVTAAAALPADTLAQIESLVKQAVPIPGAVSGVLNTATGALGGVVGGALAGGAPAPPAAAPAAPAGAPKSTRASAEWAHDRPNRNQDNSADGLPLQLRALPLPVQPPIQPPIQPPVSLPLPGSGNNNTNSSGPALPAPPAGLPVSSPFSPPLPANPPNTPAAMAMGSPPLFNGASVGGDGSCGSA